MKPTLPTSISVLQVEIVGPKVCHVGNTEAAKTNTFYYIH
jgi:hypothetical protein